MSGPSDDRKRNAVDDGGWGSPSETEDDSDGISSNKYSMKNLESFR